MLRDKTTTPFWESVGGSGCGYYGVWRLTDNALGMDALKAMFPEAKVEDMNFVLFSTSGVHGSYRTIEEELAAPGQGVSFTIVQPRRVAMRYGTVFPKTEDDFIFLKSLRASSWSTIPKIGSNTTSN